MMLFVVLIPNNTHANNTFTRVGGGSLGKIKLR